MQEFSISSLFGKKQKTFSHLIVIANFKEREKRQLRSSLKKEITETLFPARYVIAKCAHCADATNHPKTDELTCDSIFKKKKKKR